MGTNAFIPLSNNLNLSLHPKTIIHLGQKEQSKSLLFMSIGKEPFGNSKHFPDGDGKGHREDKDETDSEELISYIYTEVNRMRLEEQNKQKFLTSRPRFFSYDNCRAWVDAQNYGGAMWRDKKDWDSWIDLGEGKPSLVPSRPEEHYSRLGVWVSWKHFLSIKE